MKGMMDQAAQQGRYGDSMLVHMNPVEVAGIASLMPNGKLTTNPVTGQPEAFLPMLIPLLASWGGTAAAGALGAGAVGAAVAGGLASGVATGAITGDWERGLASGIMGAGLGGALANSGMAADAAMKATDMSDALINAAPEAGALVEQGMADAIATGVDAGASTLPTAAEATELMDQLNAFDGSVTDAGARAVGSEPIMQEALDIPKTGLDISAAGREGFGDRFAEKLGAPFQKGSGFGGNLMKAIALR